MEVGVSVGRGVSVAVGGAGVGVSVGNGWMGVAVGGFGVGDSAWLTAVLITTGALGSPGDGVSPGKGVGEISDASGF